MKKRLIINIIFLFLTAYFISAESYQRSVLALYKSSEGQTVKENEIFFYLSIPLKKMGLKVIYWDIDKGLPGKSLTEYSRAVISWFRGPSMRRPYAYLDFLDSMMESGKKVVVIDNFGAYQDRDTGDYVRPLRLNTTLDRLGVMYHGDWTQDSSKLTIVSKVSKMVEFQGKQDIKQSAFFYHFIASDRNMKTWLSINRTDKDYDPSPVIVTNRNGGFALNRYIYKAENGKVKLLLNPELFLTEALFPKASGENIALLIDMTNQDAKKILEYTESNFIRGKIPFTTINSREFRGMVPLDLRPFTAVGLILASDSGLDAAILERYLQDGGNIVSLSNARFEKLAPYLGIKKNRKTVRDSTGYRIKQGFFTGERLKIDDRIVEWSPGFGIPVDNASILATDYSGRIPLVWSARIKNGNVLVWNWDNFIYGEYLGFILESFLYVQPVGIAATPALSIMYIDDWPLPMYNVVKSPLKITDTEFYSDVWWPDIKVLLKKEGLPFTTYVIFNYNANTKPPFETGEFFVAKGNAPSKIGYEILSAGIDMGLHGYNHVSPTLQNTEINAFFWSSVDEMEVGFEHAKNEWIRLLGEFSLPRTYVAPHNIISQDGIKALCRVFPTIKSISTLRSGEGEGEVYDFGPNQEFPDVYMMPRLTSGYNFDVTTKADLVSGVLGPGVWSHFIHPDDVFDLHRSQGKDWEALKADFEKMISFVKMNYPWLKPMDATDGYRAMRTYDEQSADFQYRGNTVIIRVRESGMIFRLRFNGKKILSVAGGDVLYSYKDVDAAVIKAVEAEVVITLGK